MRNANYNADWFKNWDEITAYFLGLWLADGSISVNRYFRRGKQYAYKRVFITNTDRQLISDLAARLHVTYSTKKPKKSVLCPNLGKPCHEISINSDSLFDWLYSLVGSADKTHFIKWCQFDTNMNHLVRGFLDGDGSIFVKNYRTRHGNVATNLGSSFTASVTSWIYLVDLGQYLHQQLEVSKRKIVVAKVNSKLMYGQYDTMKLCEWMYHGATIFMKRKKAIWDGFDKNKLLRSSKFFSNKLTEVIRLDEEPILKIGGG
jgi:hypothetical protein